MAEEKVNIPSEENKKEDLRTEQIDTVETNVQSDKSEDVSGLPQIEKEEKNQEPLKKRSSDGTAYCAAGGLAIGIAAGLISGNVAPFVAGGTLVGLLAGYLIDEAADRKKAASGSAENTSEEDENENKNI